MTARGPDLQWPKGFARTASDRRSLAVLLGLPLTPRRLLAAAQTHRTAGRCLAAIRAGLAGGEADRARAERADPIEVWEAVRSAGARLVTAGDREYPPALLHLPDPPAGLFVLGCVSCERDRTVAVVGARNCSPAGREVAIEIGRWLAVAGICVVSGAARGIDAAAHEGALQAGGHTIAVLGSGIDVAYPAENRGLIERIASLGGVVSEYPPGVRAEARRFPARNRIVAALARSVVVVEGAQGSGSKITADHAAELGRDVFAVPGSVTSPLAEVPLELIRDGAGLIRGPEDLLRDLGVKVPSALQGVAEGPAPRSGEGLPDLTSVDRAVVRALGVPATPDLVATAAGIPLHEAMSALVRLELHGLVRSVGGRFERRLRVVP